MLNPDHADNSESADLFSRYQSAIDYSKAAASQYLRVFRGQSQKAPSIANARPAPDVLKQEHQGVLDSYLRPVVEKAKNMPIGLVRYGIDLDVGPKLMLARLMHAFDEMGNSKVRQCTSALLKAFEAIGAKAVRDARVDDEDRCFNRRFVRILGAEASCLIALRLARKALDTELDRYCRDVVERIYKSSDGLIHSIQKSRQADIVADRIQAHPQLSIVVLDRIAGITSGLDAKAEVDSVERRLYSMLFARALHIQNEVSEIAETATDSRKWIDRIGGALDQSQKKYQTLAAIAGQQLVKNGLDNYRQSCVAGNERLGRTIGKVGKSTWLKGADRFYQWGKLWHDSIVRQARVSEFPIDEDETRLAVLFFVQPYIKSHKEDHSKRRLLLRDADLQAYFNALIGQPDRALGLFADLHALGDCVNLHGPLLCSFDRMWCRVKEPQ